MLLRAPRYALILLALSCSNSALASSAYSSDVVVLREELGFLENASTLSRKHILNNYSLTLPVYLFGAEGVNVSPENFFAQGVRAIDIPVLVDGRRLGGDSHALQGLVIPPLASIEHVEIIRGAEAAIYGSSAIGSVLNFVTRNPSDSWGGTFAAGYSELPGHDDQSCNGTIWVGGPLTRNISLQLYTELDEKSGMETDDRPEFWVQKEQYGSKVSWVVTPGQKINLEFEGGILNITEKALVDFWVIAVSSVEPSIWTMKLNFKAGSSVT